ncbi:MULTISPECIES: DUF799 domain-containing protein [unclassified Duganella]|uniref:DUF799 domain-containing protein n=1 Tax=unclassified Duganella TaxID=2636909 RepID=UPI0006F732DD|nr:MULTISPECIES: DUF799 domain-containing protein [unclassified Duganella]KQV47692.1 hypothetical protein ASD07_12245 [Duganella sp. Root336D2]KRB82021.1 hypothetical protein ASE26_14030 [Duganella sp. Root198D2]
MIKKCMKLAACLLPAMFAVGCATHQEPYDYSAFKASKPKSIVVLPPLNNSPEVKATYGMLSQMTYPLAEAGYYVLPVTAVDETFKQNGLANAVDVHNVSTKKLQEIFGADAALYVTVTKYGSVYTVINSEVVVAAEAKLVDLKSGALLWEGKATASSAEQNNNSGGGLIGALVAAAVKQIINTATDASYPIAGVASNRMLATGGQRGLLYGPRSANYNKP